MNVQLLRKVKRAILAEPNKLNMAQWIVFMPNHIRAAAEHGFADKTEIRRLKRNTPECGTVGCIAGWSVAMSKVKRATNDSLRKLGERITNFYGEADFNVEDAAIEYLGITPDQANHLFFISNWPAEFSARIRKHKAGSKRYAEVVADVIEDFIRTNGWENYKHDAYGNLVPVPEEEEVAA